MVISLVLRRAFIVDEQLSPDIAVVTVYQTASCRNQYIIHVTCPETNYIIHSAALLAKRLEV